MVTRCSWASGDDTAMRHYHDTEWGIPSHDDRHLFEMLTLEGISQFHVALETDHDKYATLKDLFTRISVSQCIIYCNSIKRVTDLAEAMTQDNFPVCCIHSGMEKSERDAAFRDFKCGKHRVLISSNVTARGIDVQNVGVVINFDVPKNVHTYLHRIGRSGRWGRKGVAINFVTRWDIKKIKEFEVYYNMLHSQPEYFQVQHLCRPRCLEIKCIHLHLKKLTQPDLDSMMC